MYKVLIVMKDAESVKDIRAAIQEHVLVSKVTVVSCEQQAFAEVDLEAPDFAITDIAFLHQSTLRGICFVFPIIVIGHSGDSAIKAFEYRAFDFLLMPVSDVRLELAIRRVASSLGERLRRQNPSISENFLLGNQSQQRERKKLVIKETGRIRLINQSTIRYVKGAGNYVEIFLLNERKIMHRATLRSIENQLDPELFCRIHKSTLINISLIEELRPKPRGDYSVRLMSGENLVLSRNNRDKLARLID